MTIFLGLGIAVIVGLQVALLLKKQDNSKVEALSSVIDNLGKRTETVGDNVAKIEGTMRDEMSNNRQELSTSLKNFGDSSSQQIIGMTQLNEQKLENLSKRVEDKLTAIQEDNNEKLEKMRKTVDKELHDVLEQKLGQSFKMVSDRLEAVHKGLGEMQVLASGVGDLKKVLSNVKTKGILGEMQLGAILDQILTPEQYAKNLATKPKSRDNVEYAIKLPGQNDKPVWLPIDAKFPTEDFQRLVEAQDKGDIGLVKECEETLEVRIKQQAKDIRDKYISPPNTTDFGILFLPFEGLYAEVLRRPGLFEYISREYKITITGPTTMAALLNSLQMGFRTLAIQKRAGEVWQLLGAVKTEFGNFAEIFEKAQSQIMSASNTLETAASKSRNIERKLKKVQVLPAQEAEVLLEVAEESIDEIIQKKISR
jgi:DNA recombination protein RmuC